MRKQVLCLAGVLLVMGVLTSVGPVAAAKTPVDIWEVMCVENEGIYFPSSDGMTLHNRGRTTRAVLYAYDAAADEVVIVGSDTIIGNADIKFATCEGHVFGLFSLLYLPAPSSPTGTYDGAYDGHFNPCPPGGGFLARAFAEGTGDLRHQKMRLRLASDEVPTWLATYLAGNPPACADALVSHVTGSINHRN